MARRYGRASGEKVRRAIHEMKRGKLRSGRSGRRSGATNRRSRLVCRRHVAPAQRCHARKAVEAPPDSARPASAGAALRRGCSVVGQDVSALHHAGPGRPVGRYRQRYAGSTDDLMRRDWLSVPAKALRRCPGMELRRSGSTEDAGDDRASWRHFPAAPDRRHDIGCS